jgi:hypothetical protein
MYILLEFKYGIESLTGDGDYFCSAMRFDHACLQDLRPIVSSDCHEPHTGLRLCRIELRNLRLIKKPAIGVNTTIPSPGNH